MRPLTPPRSLCVFGAALLLASHALLALAQEDETAGLDACTAAALREHDGLVISWKLEPSPRAFLIEVAGKDDRTYTMRCDAVDAHLSEVKRIVGSRSYKTLAARASLTDGDAREVVRKWYPGRMSAMEYVLHWRGTARYKYYLVTPDGRDAEVEVSAALPKIVETKSSQRE
jgi:uncharacterized membrane protein YkoI